jgi:hypothetical protein
MKKMNNHYSLSTVNQVQNSKKRKKIITNKEINSQNPVKLIKPTITNINSINNNFTNSNLNFLKNKNNYDEEFEIIEPSLQNTIKKSKEKIPIINNTHSSNRNLNSINTGFTSTTDSKSLNIYQNLNDGSLSIKENKMKIIKKPKKIYGLSARELLDIVDRRKKILGLRTNYSKNSINDFKDKSGDMQTSLFYGHNYFNDISNSIDDNNFINMSFSQINTLKLSNIKNKNIKRKLPNNPSKDIVNFIFDEDEKEKNDKNKETIKLNIINNQTINNENENKEILEDNYQEFPIFENIIIENNNSNKNNKNINETKIEESLFNIEKNPNEEIEISINEFKIESNKENKLLNNYSPEKSSMLNNSFSSHIKSLISSSSSNKEEEVIQINNKKVNEVNNNISSNLFNLNKKENKKEETITRQKINFFEETLNKIPKKENKDKINENLLKLLPLSPNIGNRNLIKFVKKKNFKENNKEKNAKRLKSFDIKKEDFQTNDYCILKTSSLEKKNNRSHSKNSRNKQFRQVSKYTDFYKKKINEIVLEKKIQSNFQYNDKKKHFMIKNQN